MKPPKNSWAYFYLTFYLPSVVAQIESYDNSSVPSSLCRSTVTTSGFVTTCGFFGSTPMGSMSKFSCPLGSYITKMSGKRSALYVAAIQFHCSDGTSSQSFDSGEKNTQLWSGPELVNGINYVFVRAGSILDLIQYDMNQNASGGSGGAAYHAKDNGTNCPLTSVSLYPYTGFGNYFTIGPISLEFSCPLCSAGMQLSTQRSNCTSCPVGSWKSSNGVLPCTNCNPNLNQICPQTGMSGFMCSPGYFLNGTNCASCPAGTYKSNPGTKTCQPCNKPSQHCPHSAMSTFFCSKGYYNINDECQPCPSGTFKSTQDDSNCTVCALPQVCPSNGTKEVLCDVGYELVKNECIPCSPGTYRPTFGTNCIDCTFPSSCPQQGMSNFFCRPGYQLIDQKCEQCEVGTFKEHDGAGFCIKCPSNSAFCNTSHFECGQGFFKRANQCQSSNQSENSFEFLAHLQSVFIMFGILIIVDVLIVIYIKIQRRRIKYAAFHQERSAISTFMSSPGMSVISQPFAVDQIIESQKQRPTWV